MAHHPHEHAHPHSHDVADRNSLRVAVITVSDTRSIADDEGGAIAAELVVGAGHKVERREILRDDVDAIRASVRGACDTGIELVILTGGTGIAPRDVTYEAIEGLLEKKLDGFGEAFRARSWPQVGPRAMLSRALAGTRGRSLIVALPGSPKAVRLAVEELLLPFAPHAVGLLRG